MTARAYNLSRGGKSFLAQAKKKLQERTRKNTLTHPELFPTPENLCGGFAMMRSNALRERPISLSDFFFFYGVRFVKRVETGRKTNV